MDQLEAQRKAAVLKFTNIDREDFVHTFGGDPWTIKAGESIYFPAKHARLFAKHLAMKIINRIKKGTAEGKADGTNLYKPSDMDGLISKMLSEEKELVQPLQKTEVELHREKVEEINKMFGTQPAPSSAYMSKAEIIAKLAGNGVKFNPKDTRENLLALLTEPKRGTGEADTAKEGVLTTA